MRHRGTRVVVVLKVGGELLERAADLGLLTQAIADAHRSAVPLAVVHGGGRAIDAALGARGIPAQQVEGLRITDAATLDVVIEVLAGRINTSFVGSLVAHGVPAVGLTGADAGIATVVRARRHVTADGREVDLGLVGEPSGESRPDLLRDLIAGGYVPVVSSIGVDPAGQLLNVNADVLAAHVAVLLGASRLVVAGTTAGVLDGEGRTLASLSPGDIDALVARGTASAGMVVKLRACAGAARRGVGDVVILNGRSADALHWALGGGPPGGGRLDTTHITDLVAIT